MRKSRSTEEQIVGTLQELEAGAKISEVCRRLGVSEMTISRWRRKYGGLQVNDARRLKALEDENRQLKRIVAD
jgi:putative transposase